MHHATFRHGILAIVTAGLLRILPGCGADVDGGSGGSGGTGNGSGGATGTTTGGSGGATGTGGSTDGGLTCEERLTSAIQQVDAAVQAHLACATDADCSTVETSTHCMGDCPKAVNLQGVAAVQAAVADVNATICNGYQEDGCPYGTPGCVIATPMCAGGTCVLPF